MPGPAMAGAYRERALTVLLLFGALSAVMALLSSNLLLQLSQEEHWELPGWAKRSMEVAEATLAALCLMLNLSCLLLCLLHGHLGTELGRGQPGHDRADRFLQDTRKVRHAAVGLFCCGICCYLTALALHMLRVSALRVGIPTACALFSGIIALLITVTHTLLRALRVSRHRLPGASPSPSENGGDSSDGGAEPRPRPDTHRKFSFPVFLESKSRPGFAAGSSPGREGSEQPRGHRTLSAESGMLQAQGKAWNVIPPEMGDAMARKTPGKDLTLV
ncbi:PREDICTED: transmembrane protein 221 [Lepidothrix coronata]|uniref:Transmembrane protein 221 n=1 Tax=Lepidothrix coronata TaxID=321398 RepID=A0A6J0J466_9PASS|nr:PREDICTED: transmembrane protein 221 [Lepidothrix coronata]